MSILQELICRGLNLVFDSMDDVEDKVEEAMIHYDKNSEIVKSVTGFNWIITHV